jgi:hypothetical protein
VCAAWTRELRDEHGIEGQIRACKVAVNPEQVEEYDLQPIPLKDGESKSAQTKADRYREEHGDNVYELEAFEPDVLQAILRNAIRDVLDL